ncbi:MAG: MlaD family protein [Candidatus Omnitrophica bacterium]|nr:MlaD family protein [Candidatus Omnitrophota bacterium]
MFDKSRFELKVGLFVIIGVVIFLIIIFSIGDIKLNKNGYEFYIKFSFVDGIGKGSPVQYAGVSIGHVKDVIIYYDEEEKKNMVKTLVWINDGNDRVEKDALPVINVLGLLGEKYIEILPDGGTENGFVKANDVIRGKDPIIMSEVTESLSQLAASANAIAKNIEEGKGTIGKLFSDESLYDNLTGATSSANNIFKKIEIGEGSLGKFINQDTVYNNVEEFTTDIKDNPWKLLNKPKETKKEKSRE